jgi:hypothetical protein
MQASRGINRNPVSSRIILKVLFGHFPSPK